MITMSKMCKVLYHGFASISAPVMSAPVLRMSGMSVPGMSASGISAPGMSAPIFFIPGYYKFLTKVNNGGVTVVALLKKEKKHCVWAYPPPEWKIQIYKCVTSEVAASLIARLFNCNRIRKKRQL